MKYCANCGKAMEDNVAFCPECGAAQQAAQQAAPQQPVYQQAPQQQAAPAAPVDGGSFGWAVLGFCFPLVGLILYLVWKSNKPMSAKKAGIGALVGFVLNLIVTFLGGMA